MGEKINRGLLIELVRNESVLWNRLDKMYNNRELKSDLWDKIGKSLNTTGKMAQKTWATLRDSFKKIQRRIHCGKTTKKYVSWPYYNSLCFLDDFGQPETPKDYLSPKEEPMDEICSLAEKPPEEDSLDERDDDEDDDCYNYDESKNAEGAESRGKGKRKFEDEGSSPRKVQITDSHYFPGGKKPRDADDDYLFLMSLLPYLRKLDDVQKMRLRMEILRSVTEELENSKYQEASASSWHHAAFVMTQQASTSDSNYPHRVTPVSSSGTAPT